MARKKKDTTVEGEITDEETTEESDTIDAEPNVVEEESVKELESSPEETKVEPEPLEEKHRDIISLSPWDRKLHPMNGKFIEKLGSESIFETEDGSQYAAPYRAGHANLKAGDSFIF